MIGLSPRAGHGTSNGEIAVTACPNNILVVILPGRWLRKPIVSLGAFIEQNKPLRGRAKEQGNLKPMQDRRRLMCSQFLLCTFMLALLLHSQMIHFCATAILKLFIGGVTNRGNSC